MPAFKKLGPGDQIDNVLVLEPQWTLASGSGGWRGSPEGSASVDLYGGAHRTRGGVIREYQYEPIIPAQLTYGQLKRTNPMTSSVDLVWMTDEELTLTERSRTRWGREHFKTVMRLYDHYGRRDPDYVTASYDHYCLFFNSGSSNIVTVFDRESTTPTYRTLPTGSYTVEAWFKPFTTGTEGIELTVMSRARAFRLYVSGSTGKLNFDIHSGTATVHTSVTSSATVSSQRWHHAAVTFDRTTRSGTMYLDLQQVATFTYPSPIPNPISYTGSFHIGGAYGGAVTTNYEDVGLHVAAQSRTAFHGFIGQVRVWGSNRSWTQISASHNVRLTGSGLAGPLLCDTRLSEGPLAYGSPDYDVSGLLMSYASGAIAGSGVLDYAAAHQGRTPDYGVLYKFNDRPGPVWHPNDNTDFYLPKQRAVTFVTGTYWRSTASLDVTRMVVIHVPSAFYGRQIQPNSVKITDRSFSGPEYGLVRTLIDDGRGGLFLSGSACSSTLADHDDYRGVEWNKVGNVFYEDGLIMIKDPALLDFGASWSTKSAHPSDLLQLEFRGHTRIPVKTIVARIDRGELNRSLNPTYYRTEEDGHRTVRHPSGNLYVTTVGLYNSDRELVGVARLAEPLRVRPRDRLAIKVRMDF